MLDPRVTISEATLDDMIHIEKNLRPIDRLEAEIMGRGQSVMETLVQMQASSDKMLCGRWKGEPIVLFGIVPGTLLSRRASPWMLATTKLYRKGPRKQFLRASKRALADLAEGYEYLWNYVHARNHAAKRWLRWLGFVFPGQAVEVSGHQFEYFKMEADDVHSDDRTRTG